MPVEMEIDGIQEQLLIIKHEFINTEQRFMQWKLFLGESS